MRTSFKYITLSSMVLILSACQNQQVRHDTWLARSSDSAVMLPRASSIEDQFIPPKDGDSPNNKAAYHVTPNLSYGDRTLDDNLSGAIDWVDYYVALKNSGWQSYLLGKQDHTVLVIPNTVMETYIKTWPNPDWRDEKNRHRLKSLTGDTIVVGKWDVPNIKKQASLHGGKVVVKTLNGSSLTLKPILSTGQILVQGANGQQAYFVESSYPQANGMLYIVDSISPFTH